jgi:hypothetical protein
MNLNDYEHIIPIGSNCRIGMALRDLNLRKLAFPLDWTLTSSKSVYESFKNNFENFMDQESCIEQNLKHLIDFQHVLNVRYDVNITHEPQISPEAILKYRRKVDNLHSALSTSKRILLIRNMLDEGMSDVLHMDIALKERLQGRTHYDLEWIYKTKDLINERYLNLKVDLLVIYFNKDSISETRLDVEYRTSNIPKIGKEWDRYACIDVLKGMM